MKNEFRDKLRQMSNVKESFKQDLIKFMEKMATTGFSNVVVINDGEIDSYRIHGGPVPINVIEKSDFITFDDIKNFFPYEDFKYTDQPMLKALKISWM